MTARKMTMKQIADKKGKGWSFIDDGKGAKATKIPKKTAEALKKSKSK